MSPSPERIRLCDAGGGSGIDGEEGAVLAPEFDNYGVQTDDSVSMTGRQASGLESPLRRIGHACDADEPRQSDRLLQATSHFLDYDHPQCASEWPPQLRWCGVACSLSGVS